MVELHVDQPQAKLTWTSKNKIIMNIINYKGDDIIISLTREELQLLRSLVIEIYAGVCIDAEEFEIVSGIRNP